MVYLGLRIEFINLSTSIISLARPNATNNIKVQLWSLRDVEDDEIYSLLKYYKIWYTYASMPSPETGSTPEFQSIEARLNTQEAELRKQLAEVAEAREVVLGRFLPAVAAANRVLRLIDAQRVDKLELDLGSLFGETQDAEAIRVYLQGFSLPIIKEDKTNKISPYRHQYPFPLVRIGILPNIRGSGRTYDPSAIKLSIAGSRMNYFLSEMPVAIESAGYMVSNDTSNLPDLSQVQVRPHITSLSPERLNELRETDGIAADFALQIFREIRNEFPFHVQGRILNPHILRLLAVLPTSQDGSFVTEFVPQILWSQSDLAAPERVYRCYAMIGGKRVDCIEELDPTPDTVGISTNLAHVIGEHGRRSLWRTLGVSSASGAYVENELGQNGVTLNEVSHVALILIPFLKHNKLPSSKGDLQINLLPEEIAEIKKITAERRQFSKGRDEGSLGPEPKVHEAAVERGTESTSDYRVRSEGYRVPDPTTPPLIYLIRCLTVSAR